MGVLASWDSREIIFVRHDVFSFQVLASAIYHVNFKAINILLKKLVDKRRLWKEGVSTPHPDISELCYTFMGAFANSF